MPSRNIVKENVPDTYYHVYARGVNKNQVFIDNSDYCYFLSLFERYLFEIDPRIESQLLFQKLNDEIEILAYCIMPNHFHLLVYQINENGMSKLMHNVMSCYSQYFNKKYKRTGPLFGSRYKASKITTDAYLLHISRYIHLNPDNWVEYPYSSIRSYLYGDVPSWLNKERISVLYESTKKYLEFLDDYDETSDNFDE